MKRFLGLWLLLLAIVIVTSLPIALFVIRRIDLRLEPHLTALVATGVNAALLLFFLPELRDPRFRSPFAALQAPWLARVTAMMVATIAGVALLNVMRVVQRESFDVVRGLLLLAAAFVFLAARWKRGAGASVVLIALLSFIGLMAGRLEHLAAQLFAAQPLLFRWLVFFAALTAVVLVTVLRNVTRLRAVAGHAALLLEWAIAPAAIAAVIVVASLYWRPWLTPGWWLLANVLGALAAGFVFLSSLATLRERV